MLEIRELTDEPGTLATVSLRLAKGGALELARGDVGVALPSRALEAVTARYGVIPPCPCATGSSRSRTACGASWPTTPS